MPLRTIRRYLVNLGIQFQHVYVNCRTVQGGEACIRRLMLNVSTVEFTEASDGFMYDFRSDESDEETSALTARIIDCQSARAYAYTSVWLWRDTQPDEHNTAEDIREKAIARQEYHANVHRTIAASLGY